MEVVWGTWGAILADTGNTSSHSGTSRGASGGACSHGSAVGTILITAGVVPEFSSRRLSARSSICKMDVVAADSLAPASLGDV